MKSTTCCSKGVGTTAGTIMLMIIFLIFFGVYLYMVNNHVQSTIELNLESSQILKLKSTFALFNASLGNTWLISTVQSIFMTGDESIGCGIDTSNRLPAGYWYWRDPNQDRDGLTDAQGRPIERIPATNKGNVWGRNPQICYPRDNHVLDYLQAKLECEDFLSLKNPMDNVGGVAISFNSGRNVCSGNNRAVASFLLDLNDDNVESKFSQSLAVVYGDGRIDAQTENNIKVMTSLRQMVAAAREAVANLLILGDAHEQHYPVTQYLPGAPDKDSYQSGVKSRVDAILTARVPSGVLATTDIQTDMRAADNSVSNVVPTGLGLVVHYKATATYTETNNAYYYNNGAANTFVKRPIKLEYIAEDYMPALDCTEWPKPANPPRPTAFNWQSTNDMVCCAGYLFSCNVNIPGLDPAQALTVNTRLQNSIWQQGICIDILSGATLSCTPNGFELS